MAALTDPHRGQVALLAHLPDGADVEAEDAGRLPRGQKGRCRLVKFHVRSIVTGLARFPGAPNRPGLQLGSELREPLG